MANVVGAAIACDYHAPNKSISSLFTRNGIDPMHECDYYDDFVGCDAVYVFWIHHQESREVFNFTGRRDVRRFLELAHQVTEPLSSLNHLHRLVAV